MAGESKEEGMSKQTVKCPICGEPYTFYAYSAADQSACSDCIAKAKEKEGKWKDVTTVKDLEE